MKKRTSWMLSITAIVLVLALASFQHNRLYKLAHLLTPQGEIDRSQLPAKAVPPYLAAIQKQRRLDLSRLLGDSHFYIFDDHNRVLDAVKDMKSRGLYGSKPTAIVHIDYHADLYRNNLHLSVPPTIGNYINKLISDHDVDEVWWIVPDATRDLAAEDRAPGAAVSRQREVFWGRDTFADWQFRDGPADQAICVSQADGALSFGPEDMPCPDKKVLFHKRTNQDILTRTPAQDPYLQVPERYQTILDIDGDFFDYTGIYANDGHGPFPRKYRLHYKNTAILHEEFGRLLAGVERMKAKPFLTTCAMSPFFVSLTAQDEVEYFLTSLGLFQQDRSYFQF